MSIYFPFTKGKESNAPYIYHTNLKIHHTNKWQHKQLDRSLTYTSYACIPIWITKATYWKLIMHFVHLLRPSCSIISPFITSHVIERLNTVVFSLTEKVSSASWWHRITNSRTVERSCPPLFQHSIHVSHAWLWLLIVMPLLHCPATWKCKERSRDNVIHYYFDSNLSFPFWFILMSWQNLSALFSDCGHKKPGT